MKPTFGERIKEARKQKGLTQKQLADLIGAAHNSISDWENNKNKPDPDTIELLCGVLKITPNYLLASSEENFSPKEKLLIQKYRFVSEVSPEGVNVIDTILDREYSIAERMAEKEKHIIQLEEKQIPIRLFAYYGKIAAAGKGYGFEDVISGTIEAELTEKNQNADYTIGVSGDSMEPTFFDGDIIYVKKTTHLNVGDIGIFQKDNCIYIKEVGENGLISHNSKYEPMTNGGDVICLGKVIGKVEEQNKSL